MTATKVDEALLASLVAANKACKPLPTADDTARQAPRRQASSNRQWKAKAQGKTVKGVPTGVASTLGLVHCDQSRPAVFSPCGTLAAIPLPLRLRCLPNANPFRSPPRPLRYATRLPLGGLVSPWRYWTRRYLPARRSHCRRHPLDSSRHLVNLTSQDTSAVLWSLSLGNLLLQWINAVVRSTCRRLAAFATASDLAKVARQS